MKNFLLVLFIGMVLAINVYGIVQDFAKDIQETEKTSEVYTIVYEE